MPEALYPQTLGSVFSRALAKYADRPAVSGATKTLTYRDIDRRARGLAADFSGAGLSPGDRVAIMLENDPVYPVVDLAVMRSGGVRLPLNPNLAEPELAYILSDGRPAAAVVDAEQADMVADLDPTPDRVFAVGDARVTTDVTRVASVGATAVPSGDNPDIGPDDDAGLYYTGGTTGRPKGVRYTHRTLVANLQAHLAEFGFGGTDSGLLVTPLSHSAGTFCWAALLAGGRVHLERSFHPEALLESIHREDITWTFAVPTMIYRLLDAAAIDDVDLSSLAKVIYGAAPAQPDRLREAIERFGPVVHQFYGQTEVPNLISTFPPAEHHRAYEEADDDRLASAGTAALFATVEIRDSETGKRCPPGEAGEVVVAAPYTFEGYFERPEDTAETWRDGWVHTGDIGVLDEDGYLTLLDREADVIVTGGLNVYSRAVERALATHPAVASVLVVGVPHQDWGEAVHALVVRDGEVSADVLRDHAGGQLADYQRPKTIEFVEELPTTALGKPDRAAVRERYWRDEDRSVH